MGVEGDAGIELGKGAVKVMKCTLGVFDGGTGKLQDIGEINAWA